MTWKRKLWLGLAVAACSSPFALAQTPYPALPAPLYAPSPENNGTLIPDGNGTVLNGNGEPVFDPVQGIEPAQMEPKPGPTPVKSVRFLMDDLGMKDLFGDSGIIVYGWLDGGYTYSSTGSGRLATQPRENRFGNEFIANQLAIAFEKPLKQEGWDFGFKSVYFAGADAALLHPLGGFPANNPRFAHDFRDLYVSAHLPLLTEGGIDVQVGRMTTPIGYTGALAPFRTYYSNDYQWFYSQDGAWTGVLTSTHVTKQLDVLAGMTLGANTFFRTRSAGSYCGITQVNYWLTEEKKTLLTASAHFGKDAIFAAPGLNGDFATVVELRVFHTWNKGFDQVVQCNMGWDENVAALGGSTAEWYGLYTIGMFHLSRELDFNVRAEWFNDVQGTRTGFKNHYEEFTLGLNYHPVKCLEIRPEVRYDIANDTPAFGPDNRLRREQVTAAVECLIKF